MQDYDIYIQYIIIKLYFCEMVKILSKINFDMLLKKSSVVNNNVEEYNYIFISIHNSDEIGNLSKPYFNENKKNVLNLTFDDLEKPIKGKDCILFNDDMANEILEFLENNKDVSKCFVHCSAGVSRSGAVGTFVLNFFNWDYKEFRKINSVIKPNGLVLRKLNRLLWD